MLIDITMEGFFGLLIKICHYNAFFFCLQLHVTEKISANKCNSTKDKVFKTLKI